MIGEILYTYICDLCGLEKPSPKLPEGWNMTTDNHHICSVCSHQLILEHDQ